jgi:hypothetical protein
VDFTSSSSLVAALISQATDALIVLLPGGAVRFASQKLFIDAAIEVGVKLFVADEYAGDIMSEHYKLLTEIVGEKRMVREYLEEKIGKEAEKTNRG